MPQIQYNPLKGTPQKIPPIFGHPHMVEAALRTSLVPDAAVARAAAALAASAAAQDAQIGRRGLSFHLLLLSREWGHGVPYIIPQRVYIYI